MDKENFLYAIEESKNKNEAIQSQSQEIYSQLLLKMYLKEENESEQEYSLRIDKIKNFIEGTYLQIIKRVDERLRKPTERESFKYGYTTRDPYFLANFKALMPIIKKNYFDEGATAMMILHNYDPETTNEAIFRGGGGYITMFLNILREQAEEYNKKLFIKGIDKTMKPVRIKGIPMGVLKDIITNMRKHKAQLKKELRIPKNPQS